MTCCRRGVAFDLSSPTPTPRTPSHSLATTSSKSATTTSSPSQVTRHLQLRLEFHGTSFHLQHPRDILAMTSLRGSSRGCRQHVTRKLGVSHVSGVSARMSRGCYTRKLLSWNVGFTAHLDTPSPCTPIYTPLTLSQLSNAQFTLTTTSAMCIVHKRLSEMMK